MAVAPARRLRLLIPTADGGRAIRVDGDLPSVDLDVADGSSTSETIARWLPTIGLHPWLVECVVDQIEEHRLAGRPRHVFVETPAPPHRWTRPVGWEWHRWDDLAASFDDGIAAAGDQRLAEWRGEAPVPAARAEWARPGWYEEASGWISATLAGRGRAEPTAITPVRHWGITTVLRVESSDGGCWFKATIPLFRAEAAITAELARRSAGVTGGVVAIDADRGWMLLDEVRDVGDETAAHSASAIDRLVALQASLATGTIALSDVDLPARPISELPVRAPRLLRSPVVEAIAPLSDRDLDAATRRLRAAVANVEQLGFPATLVHGDLHPGNVATSVEGPVIFDWSDACIGSPIVDIGPWASWYADDAERSAQVWRWFCDAWEHHLSVDMGGVERRTVDIVAGAFHVDSYVRILEAVEPYRRHELADGLAHFLRLLTG